MAGPWKDARGLIVTTTPTIEGRPIQDYLGIVTGEVIVGANLFQSGFTGLCPLENILHRLGVKDAPGPCG